MKPASSRPKRKGVSASTLKQAAVYGGLVLGAINPIAGAIAAGVFYRLYKKREKAEVVERAEEREAARKQYKAQFYERQRFSSYEHYLSSSLWLAKRLFVMQRAAGCCENPECAAAAEEVHHKRYPRVWGEEPVDWLIALCARHHREAHGSGRQYIRRSP